MTNAYSIEEFEGLTYEQGLAIFINKHNHYMRAISELVDVRYMSDELAEMADTLIDKVMNGGQGQEIPGVVWDMSTQYCEE